MGLTGHLPIEAVHDLLNATATLSAALTEDVDALLLRRATLAASNLTEMLYQLKQEIESS